MELESRTRLRLAVRTSLAFGLVLALAVPLSAAERDGTVVRGDLGEALDAVVNRVTGGAFWGAVLVAKEGEVILAKGYGMADFRKRPNETRTLFEIASTSKPFTAAAVVKLEMEKRLKLSDPLPKFFKGVPPDKRKITVYQLITHTSGMDPNAGLSYAARETRKEFVRFILKAKLVSKPGEKFAYFNSGYALLAAIIEVASGKSFEAYMKGKLFKPAGLKDTGFVNDKSLDASRASARDCSWFPNATAVKWCWSWGYRGMGGVVSTVYDLLRWDRALRGKKILNEEAKKKCYTPCKAKYALGWFVDTTPRGTTKVHHSGGVAGYAVNYVRYLEDDAVVIVLSNGKSNIHALSDGLAEPLFEKPRIGVTIDVRKHKLNRSRAVELGTDSAWSVRKGRGGRLQLLLLQRSTKRPLVTLDMPPGYGKGLAGRIEGFLTAPAKAGRKQKAGMDAGVYLGSYTLKKKMLTLSEEVVVRIQPRYESQDRSGKEIVDDRITFIVQDTRIGQWPVMVMMDDPTAKKLAEDLTEATK
ncbi:MAG: serine hydrolase domain-containing protein [Planctomycetota bacterium]